MAKGLQTFLLHKMGSEACSRVDFRVLLEKYKSDKDKKEVTIAVSGVSLVRTLYGDLNWPLGGQFKEYETRVSDFVRAFEPLGVHLVFFFEGVMPDRKIPYWVERRYSEIKENIKLFDKLKSQRFSFDENDMKKPSILTTLTQIILKYDLDCDVRVAVGECYNEIAEFALKEKNCFGYIGQDTHFVICNIFKNVFFVEKFDIKSMTAVRYDSLGLARELNIPPTSLPILATLLGNDLILANDLHNFHKQILKKYPHRKATFRMSVIAAVSDFVRTLPTGNEIYAALPVLSRTVFNDTTHVRLLEESIRSYVPKRMTAAVPVVPKIYSPSSNWGQIILKAHSTFNSQFNYDLIVERKYKSGNVFEDPRKKDLPLTTPLYLKLRMRLYGILLKESPNGPGKVKEWCCAGLGSLDKAAIITPVIPPEELYPGLLTLCGESDRDSEDIVNLRWKLFAHTVSPTLDVDALRCLVDDGNAHLVLPTAILKYLREAIPREASFTNPQIRSSCPNDGWN